MTIHRRTLLDFAAASAAAAATGVKAATPIDNGRPVPARRNLSSPAIEAAIERTQARIGTATRTAAKLGRMFAECCAF